MRVPTNFYYLSTKIYEESVAIWLYLPIKHPFIWCYPVFYASNEKIPRATLLSLDVPYVCAKFQLCKTWYQNENREQHIKSWAYYPMTDVTSLSYDFALRAIFLSGILVLYQPYSGKSADNTFQRCIMLLMRDCKSMNDHLNYSNILTFNMLKITFHYSQRPWLFKKSTRAEIYLR